MSEFVEWPYFIGVVIGLFWAFHVRTMSSKEFIQFEKRVDDNFKCLERAIENLKK